MNICFVFIIFLGNGNCLLHAILISMVAVHDFDLIMRDLLIKFMESKKDALKNYWKTDRIQADKIYGIQSEESTLETVSITRRKADR